MRNNNEYPTVPKDFITAPIFASKPQAGAREVHLNHKRYTIGGFQPISEDRPACPALDIRHGRALFTILSFVAPYEESGIIRFSINEFCKRFASSNGGRYARDIKGLLSDLERCWFRIEDESSGTSESYRILKNISIHIKEPRKKPKELTIQQGEMWIDEVELHPKFLTLLQDYMSIAQIHLKTLTEIRSPLAQSIYAYIPSRAVHHDKNDPFEIVLSKLLEQVSHSVPHSKSVRKKIFTQNQNPVIAQLNGAKILGGRLGVDIQETADKKDYKLLFWLDSSSLDQETIKDEKPSVLKGIWLKTGRSLEEFSQRMQNLPDFDSYQLELFEKGNIKLEGNSIFFRQALALLGSGRFNELLSEAKTMHLEGQKVVKSETQRLIFFIKDALARSF